MEPLTSEQVFFAVRQFSRWLSIKEKWEPKDWSGPGREEKRWQLNELAQHRADVDHSALLRRLLSGKEPLAEPPPLKHAYPDYPDQ